MWQGNPSIDQVSAGPNSWPNVKGSSLQEQGSVSGKSQPDLVPHQTWTAVLKMDSLMMVGRHRETEELAKAETKHPVPVSYGMLGT